MCSFFVASWTGVVKYHGPKPSMRPKQVFVANHTSMIDFIILEQMTVFAIIMQKHPGWVGLLQKTILESVGCIWFNRSESKDREIVAKKLRDHVVGPDNNPLLIFPVGTCVNNHYTVMFKKGAFELGCSVCPVAIKYNKIFVVAFWNSRKQSFTMHLLQLMTSWAVVCDVWYLEPENMKPGETAIEFAEAMEYLLVCREQGGSSSPKEFYNFLTEFQKASRNFAKQQLTWFRNEHIYHWLDASKPLDTVLNFICDAYHDKSGNWVVPESLQMKKELSSHREESELKTYRTKNRHFIRREDCSDILDWIQRTQG